MANVRNCVRLEFNKKYEYEKIKKQHSKLTFNGTHISKKNCDNYIFRKNAVLMDKPIHLGFAILDLSKLLLCETIYEKVQQYFGAKNLQFYYMDTGCSVLCVNTNDLIKDLKILEYLFDFSNLNEDHELFSEKK